MKTIYTKPILYFLLGSFLFACQPQNADKEKQTEQKTNSDTLQEVENNSQTADKIEYDTNDVHSMIAALEQANGGEAALKKLKNVEFDYHYLKPDGKKDVSVERYIFDGEASWAKYTTHEVNVAPDLEGEIVQYYDGEKTEVYHQGEKIDDPKMIGGAQFMRKANLMWFCMMFKLDDPGTIPTYQGRKTHEGADYDVVKITYDSSITGKAQNDIFVLYIHPETYMADYFYFSLPAMGINDPVLYAKVTYEEIDGIQVSVRREMFAPNPESGEMEPLVDEVSKNVKFNNDFTAESLSSKL